MRECFSSLDSHLLSITPKARQLSHQKSWSSLPSTSCWSSWRGRPLLQGEMEYRQKIRECETENKKQKTKKRKKEKDGKKKEQLPILMVTLVAIVVLVELSSPFPSRLPKSKGHPGEEDTRRFKGTHRPSACGSARGFAKSGQMPCRSERGPVGWQGEE